jgi:hypothetical protein
MAHRYCIWLFLAATLSGGWACAPTTAPRWLSSEGHGVEQPWLNPGQARRKAREAAIQQARVNLWNQLLPMQILQNDPETGAPNEIEARGSSASDGSAAEGQLRATASPEDALTTTVWAVDTLRPIPPEQRNSPSQRGVWGSDTLSAAPEKPRPPETKGPTPRVGEEEEAGLSRLTIEQLAAVSPVFRAKIWSMIEALEPRAVEADAEGRVTAVLQIDLNEVMDLARRYLDKLRKP